MRLGHNAEIGAVRQLLEFKAAVVVGASGVGEKALRIPMTHHCFVKDHKPTIQDSYWKAAALDYRGGYILNVLDTAGQDTRWALQDRAWQLVMACWASLLLMTPRR